MNTLLTEWLDNHRYTLLPRWRALLEETPYLVTHPNGNGVISHVDEQERMLAAMYDGLIKASQGDYTALENHLQEVQITHSDSGQDQLNQELAFTFQLRHAAWDLILEQNIPLQQAHDLLQSLEKLLEYTVTKLTRNLSDSANVVVQQLQQAEMLAASLAETSEQADHIALQMSNLNTIAESLASSLDYDYLIKVVGDKLMETLDVASLIIWIPKENGRLYPAQCWGTKIKVHYEELPDEPTDTVLQAYRGGESLLKQVTESDPQEYWRLPNCAALAVPLLTYETPTGVLLLQTPHPEVHLGPQRTSFVHSVASQLATALENARLYSEVRNFNTVLEQRITERTEELRNEHAMLETLNQIALEVSSTLDLDLLLHNCLTTLAKLVHVHRGSIMLIEPDTGHLVDRAVLGEQESLGYTRFPVGQGIAGWVAQSREPALIADITQDEHWVELPHDENTHKTTGSMIAVPLIVQHEVFGVMLLSHPDVDYFNNYHLRLLNASAGEIALGLHNAMLYEEIQQQLLRQGERLRNERRSTTQSTAILQSLSDGVIVCDTEGSVLTANPAAERILDRSVEELLTWQLPDLLTRLFGAESQHIPMENLLTEPQDVNDEPVSYSGDFSFRKVTLRLTLDPVITSKNELLGLVAVFRDITREVEADRLKDEFIGTVSHELRTPMTSIKGFTQLLVMGSLGPVNESQQEFLNIIHTNAERMVAIINDLLDITKIEAGSIDLDLRPIHLAEALSKVVLDLQNRIQDHQHTLSINIPSRLSLILVDSKRFDQILENVLSNAIKFTPPGGCISIDACGVTSDTVTIPEYHSLQPGRYVQITVSDTGVGIAPDEHDLVFQRFYRTENPLKVAAGGTGLGLSLVQSLIKLFGGRIWMESEVDQGTHIHFIVPAA
ncbi:MAG: ATP-binding protein [Chloroflexota bacterium]